MYTCQCEGCQLGQSNGAMLKEVAAFQRCPLMFTIPQVRVATLVRY